jgi:MFS family permease
MLQQWLNTLPQQAGSRALMMALIVAGLGLFFWLIGSRFSRSIFTLLGVALGTWIGLRMPRWMGWEMDAMAFAIGGALALGFAGYLLHTMWVGWVLGLLLAFAGAFVAWHRVGNGAASIPWIDFSAPPTDIARELWTNCLSKLPRAIPITMSVCLSGGGLIAWMWPKVGRVLMFSMLGSLMLAGGAIAAMSMSRPEWLNKLPASTQTQGIGLAILMMLGTTIQWMLLPRVRKTSVSLSDESGNDGGNRPSRKMKLKEARA